MVTYSLRALISNINDLNDEAVIYVKKHNGTFGPDAEAVVLELDEAALQLPTAETAQRQCPGFAYFLEVFIIKEVLEGFAISDPGAAEAEKTARVIYYADSDA